MVHSNRFNSIVSLILLLLLFFSGCHFGEGQKENAGIVSDEQTRRDPDQPLQKVVLLPYWVTTAQFAGYYVGRDHGIFAKYGIDLEILPYQPSMSMTDLIRDNRATFYLFWLVNAIEYRDAGLDIVNIAQISSRSSLMLITKKSSGIETISDMDGKRAAIWQEYEFQPKVLFKRNKVDVRIISIGSSNNLFLSDGAEIINANWFDEYHTILNSGYDSTELETFFFYDHGLNFLEDGIYTHQSVIDTNPGLCKRFIGATLESWVFAFEHPEITIETVLQEQRKDRMPANKSHQEWMLARYRDLYYPCDTIPINTDLPEKEFASIAAILMEAGLISKIPDFSRFYQPYNQLSDQPQPMH